MVVVPSRARAPVFLLACLLSASALAAQPGTVTLPGDRDLQRERQQRLLDEQQKRLQELQQLPGNAAQPAQPAVDPDAPCMTIQRVELLGATLLSATQQARLVEPWQGRCLSANDLNELLKAVTQIYLDAGYVTTRAYLPQQDLNDGTLQVQVVEGRIEGLFSPEGHPSARELAMTFPGEIGKVLNLRELEQMIDQLGRLPSRAAQLELVPGEQVGGSRVQVKGTPSKPWRVSLARHNDGQLSTGEQQMGAGLDWDSPLGLADQLSLRLGHDVVSDSFRHSHNESLYYSLPYGWWTFSYSYSQSYYRTQNQANGFAFMLDGDSKTHQLSAERLLHRDNVSKTSLSLGASHLRTRNYLEEALIDVSSQRLSEAQLGLNHGRRIGTAFINVDAGWQRGVGWFDAQESGNPRGGQPVARYNKYTLTLSYLQPFSLWGESFSFDSLASGQRSEDVLFSPQRLSVGGQSSVRGFKEQSLSGDSGAYWRNQLRWRRPVTWAPLQPVFSELSLGFAYDVGVIHGGRYNPDQRGRLTGNAIELSARGQHVAASVSFARSLERPDAIERQEHPLYFRLDLFF